MRDPTWLTDLRKLQKFEETRWTAPVSSKPIVPVSIDHRETPAERIERVRIFNPWFEAGLSPYCGFGHTRNGVYKWVADDDSWYCAGCKGVFHYDETA